MSVDTAIGAASQICGFVAPPVFRQFGYVVFCERNAAELKEQVAKLKNAKARLQHRIDVSTSAGELIEDDVLTWLNNANELIKSSTLIWETNQVTWYLGFVPSPRVGYRLGRCAKKSIPKFEIAFSELNFEEVSYRPSLRIGTAASTKRHMVALKSQGLVLESVMEALNDDNVRAIGVYGMGGVGKTTLLKEIENQVKELSKFDGVTSVFVSQTPDMARIRAEIKCGVGLPGETTKTILLLLDDLWNGVTHIDFEVPEDNDNVKVRLVMTSRNQHLLADEMRCSKTFCVGTLDKEEGWEFFSELVGSPVEVLHKSSTASDLLKKCAGLAISIEALATLWKKKANDSSLSSTDFSVDELIHEKESLDGSVSIELSYNYLGDSEEKLAKLLFRTIGLLRSPNVPILTLLKYGVGLDLFGNGINGNIMERARREVTRSFRTLQDSSLLLESDDRNHVKIHDVVRDVAARVASTHDHALIFNAEDDGVKAWSIEKLNECTTISLPYSAVSDLHEGWNCPNLNTLIMEAGAKQGESEELPNSFFNGMIKLKVIDVRNARFTSMLCFLQSDLYNLTTLCLHCCFLENVAGIGKLESLQVLSFVGSDIAELPEEIGELTKLRLLDLSKCLKLELIKPGVLERLKQLEELYLRESFDRWQIEGDGQQQSNSSLAELNNLHRMRTLEVRVSDTSKLPPNLPLGDLVQYNVLIGDAWDWHTEYKESRTLKFKVMKSYNVMTQEWLQSALQKTQDLHLDGLCGPNESFHEVCREGFKELKHLHLQNSSSIKCIIWSTKWVFCCALSVLESMNLEKLENLEKICYGLIDFTSFSQLKIVKVQMCDKLRNLFNLSLVKSLTKLEEIEVSDCKMVHEIFIAEKADDEDDGTDEDHKKVMTCCPINRSKVSETRTDVTEVSKEDPEILSNLRCLTLRNLPEVTTFFTTEAPSTVDTTQPPFFSDQQSKKPSKIKHISSSAHLALGLGNLRRVEVVDCKKVGNFVNSRMLLKLVNLESLTIARCESLKDIFDLGEIDGNVEILPKLFELKLSELPKLEHIWKKNFKQIEGCRKLRTLEIHHCESLPYLSSSSMCKGMENLTEINILYCDKLETIFLEEEEPAKDPSTVIHFASLKILGISECQNLKAFYSGSGHGHSCSASSCLHIDYSTAFKCSSKLGITCWCCDMDVADSSRPFFSEKVFLPSLESLVLSSLGEFEKLWCSEVSNDKSSFKKLEFLSVKWCRSLSVVLPATLIERLQNLKHISIGNCSEVRTVIDVDVDWKTKKKPKVLILSRLQELNLDDLDNLRHIIKRDSMTAVGFPSLKQLAVGLCGNLISLISFSTATTLLKLEKLTIQYCDDLREVIHHEEFVTDSFKREVITFPYLTSLCMTSLDNLTYFSSESCLFNLTCLKFLNIKCCENLKTLVKATSKGHAGSEDEVQALFSDKVHIPNLEKLLIKSIRVEGLWCSKSEAPMDSFCKLKSLVVEECSRLGNIIPSLIIKRLQKLEEMSISHCESLDDVFENPSDQQLVHDPKGCTVDENRHLPTQTIIILANLTSLRIYRDVKFSNLRSGGYTLELPSLRTLNISVIAHGEAILEKVYLPNLEKLEVIGTEIRELWRNEPHHVGSFCKLRHLKVEKCGEVIKNIIPSFMLKRLQNLEKLEVKKCDRLETVAELGAGGGLIDTQTESKQVCFSFQKLTSVHVEDCKSLLHLFTVSELQHELYGETTPKCCDGFVIPHLTNLSLEELPQFIHLLQVQEEGHCTLELPSLVEFFSIGTGGDKESTTTKVIFQTEHVIRENNITFFGSTTTVLMDMMKALRRTDIIIIGALGKMSDLSGKIEQQDEGELFDKVIYCWRDADSMQEKLGHVLDIIYGKAGVQGRAQRLRKSLLSNRDKRLLVVLTEPSEDVDLEAAGIPLDELDPNLFKIILVSDDREQLLEKFGAQQLIHIGNSIDQRSKIITEPMKNARKVQVDFDTNDCSFSAGFGSNTIVMNKIIMALYSLQNNNNQIIGLLGREDIIYYDYLFEGVAGLAVREPNEFDDVVGLDGSRVYDQYKTVAAAVPDHERAQLLRQSLLNNKENRMLLMILEDLDQEMDLQVIGVPLDELDPKLFKIILFSNNREVLLKMGAQQVIDISSVTKKGHFYITLSGGYVEFSEFEKLTDECGCDKLAIRLGKKLEGKLIHEWANAFQLLKDSPFEYEARKRVIDSL